MHTAAPGRRLATLLLHQLIRLHRLDLLLHQHVLLLLNLAHYRWWQVLARSSGRLLRLRFHQLALLLSSCLVVLVVIIVAVLIVASPRRRSPVRLRRWRLPVLLRRPTRRRPTRRRPTRWTAAWRWTAAGRWPAARVLSARRSHWHDRHDPLGKCPSRRPSLGNSGRYV